MHFFMRLFGCRHGCSGVFGGVSVRFKASESAAGSAVRADSRPQRPCDDRSGALAGVDELSQL